MNDQSKAAPWLRVLAAFASGVIVWIIFRRHYGGLESPIDFLDLAGMLFVLTFYVCFAIRGRSPFSAPGTGGKGAPGSDA